MKNKELSEVDKMLQQFENGEELFVDKAKELFPNLERSGFMDFEHLQKRCRIHAKKRVISIAQYYLTEELMNEEFIKAKIKSDAAIIGNQMFVLRAAEHTLKKLMEEIDCGNYNHRMFEVFAKAQQSIVETSKNLTQLETACENSYRIVLQEYQAYKELKKTATGSPYAIVDKREEDVKALPTYTRGQKGILNMISENIEKKDPK